MKKNIRALLFFFCVIRSEEPILIISVPKCSTHLIGKVIALISGKKHRSPGIHNIQHDIVPIIRDALALSKNNSFSHTHTAYSARNLGFIKKHNMCIFCIYRDPRDYVVSYVYHANKGIVKPPVSVAQGIYKAIASNNIEIWRGGVDYQFRSMFGWMESESVCTIRFEDLIGKQGGGSHETQIKTIIKIAHHLNREIDERDAELIAQKLFGGTNTFREGLIGSWKKHFTEDHKNYFKKHAQALLIELGYEESDGW